MSHATPGAHTLREVVLDLLQGLALRLQQTEVQEHDTDAADGSVEEEGAVQSEGKFNVEERFRTEKQEHVATCCRDTPRQAARPGTHDKQVRRRSVCCAGINSATVASLKCVIFSWSVYRSSSVSAVCRSRRFLHIVALKPYLERNGLSKQGFFGYFLWCCSFLKHKVLETG